MNHRYIRPSSPVSAADYPRHVFLAMPDFCKKIFFNFLFLGLLQSAYPMENNDESIYSNMLNKLRSDPLGFPRCKAIELTLKNGFLLEDWEIIKDYIIKGANPNWKIEEDENTPLSLAVRNQKKINFLLQYKNHITPLVIALCNNNPIESIKALFKLGASLTKDNKNNNTFHFIIDPLAIHYIEPLITHVHFDDFDNFKKGSKKTIPFALWFFEQLKLNNNIFIPNDIKFRILSNLPLSDLYPYKKLCTELLQKNYHHILLPAVHERVENIKQILATPNNKNKTALQLMFEEYAHDQEHINKLTPLLNGELLQNNYDDFIEDFPDILNSELEKDKKNLARQIFHNCAQLFLE